MWILANLSLLCNIPAYAVYLERELRVGAFPIDGDSISIPIGEAALSVLVALLPLNIMWWFLTRYYPGRVNLAESMRGLRYWQKGTAVVGWLIAIVCIVVAVDSLRTRAWELALVSLLMCYIALAMRAAFIASSRQRHLPQTSTT